nr:uncharacterized protein LOC111773651 [Equus caballus]
MGGVQVLTENLPTPIYSLLLTIFTLTNTLISKVQKPRYKTLTCQKSVVSEEAKTNILWKDQPSQTDRREFDKDKRISTGANYPRPGPSPPPAPGPRAGRLQRERRAPEAQTPGRFPRNTLSPPPAPHSQARDRSPGPGGGPAARHSREETRRPRSRPDKAPSAGCAAAVRSRPLSRARPPRRGAASGVAALLTGRRLRSRAGPGSAARLLAAAPASSEGPPAPGATPSPPPRGHPFSRLHLPARRPRPGPHLPPGRLDAQVSPRGGRGAAPRRAPIHPALGGPQPGSAEFQAMDRRAPHLSPPPSPFRLQKFIISF